MTVKESTLANQVNKVVSIQIGDLYFFNDIVISEIKDGIHVTFENAQEFIKEIKDYFEPPKPFGLISNMVNSYSVNLPDSTKFREQLNNLSAYVMVSHNAAGKLNVEIASNFCQAKDVDFEDLYEAFNWVSEQAKTPIKNI